MSPALTLREVARALGGEVSGRQVLAPGPNHGPRDRSLSVRLSAQSQSGFVCHSFADDPFDACRDYVASKLGIGQDAWRREINVYNVHSDLRRSDMVNLYNVQGDKPDHAARIARAVALWNEAGDARGTIVETYLASRGLNLTDGTDVLRFHRRTPWRDVTRAETIFVPAMVAAMRSIETDAITAVHRTRLTPEGAKVDRRMLGIAAGAAVKLDPDDTVTMGLAIGEGIETCLAARQLGFRPAWALASAGAITAFPVLGGVECLTILAENDQTNAKAGQTCAQRWHAAGREVVVVQPKRGSDLNDAIRAAA